jgi:hypothetical protein
MKPLTRPAAPTVLIACLAVGILAATLGATAHASQSAIPSGLPDGTESIQTGWSIHEQGPRVTRLLDRFDFDNEERKTTLSADPIPTEVTPDALLLMRVRRF